MSLNGEADAEYATDRTSEQRESFKENRNINEISNLEEQAEFMKIILREKWMRNSHA